MEIGLSERADECVAALGRAAAQHGVHRAQGTITVSVTPDRRLTPELVDRYRAAGVHRLIPLLAARTLDAALAAVEANAPEVLLR
jgi:hypothetical protein